MMKWKDVFRKFTQMYLNDLHSYSDPLFWHFKLTCVDYPWKWLSPPDRFVGSLFVKILVSYCIAAAVLHSLQGDSTDTTHSYIHHNTSTRQHILMQDYCK